MTVLIKGIDRLSQLLIDADKDWNTKGITDIKQVVAAMSTGDLIVKGDTILTNLAAGVAGYVLTSTGTFKIPTWAPAGGGLKYYFPAPIFSSHSESIKVADQSVAKNAALATAHLQDYTDTPADYIRRLDKTVVSSKTVTTIAAADQSVTKTAQPLSGLSLLVDGFVEETALGVQTDHTAQARDGTANDLNLNPMSDTVLDKVYIGSSYKFWEAQTQVGTVGVGNWTNVWYYWNGLIWTPVVNEIDGGSNWFQSPGGLKLVRHTPQPDWALSIIQGKNLYWLMDRTDNFVNRNTKPLGSQIWVAIGDH